MMNANTYPWKDRLIAAVLVAAVFFLSFSGTTSRPFWGDDYAAYMNEGIAIAEGRFTEQKKINFRSHPTDIQNSEVPKSGELVYAWGYPLLISGVYRLFGYETGSFSSMGYYRAISAALFALMAGAFYLWCRTRFSVAGALVLAVFLGTCRVLYNSIGSYYADIPFIALSVISFYLWDRYGKTEGKIRKIALGILLGGVLFLTREMRFNGFSVAACCLIKGIIDALRNRERPVRERIRELAVPAAAFFVPLIIFEGFVFGPATVEGAAFAGAGLFMKNLRYAAYTLKDWFQSGLIFRSSPAGGALGTVTKLSAYGMLLVAAIGFFGDMLKNEPHVALFLTGNLIGVSVLPYAIDQGGRYHYFLLPYAVFCFGCGVRLIIAAVKKRLPERKDGTGTVRICFGAAAVLYCALAAVITVRTGAGMPADADCAYSDAALAMYRYIIEETDETCTILTQKPRVLRLNTGRDAIAIANGHTAEEADYLLDIRTTYKSNTVPQTLIDSMDKELVVKYGNLSLYRILKEDAR